jgi:hypothetical protein
MTAQTIKEIIESYEKLEDLIMSKLKEFAQIDLYYATKVIDYVRCTTSVVSVFTPDGIIMIPVEWLVLDKNSLIHEIQNAKEKRLAQKLKKLKEESKLEYQSYLRLKAKYERV